MHRLLALTRQRRLDRELDGEVLAHLELAERDAIAAGLSPADARAAARRHFGGIDQMKEAHRDHRSARWIETLVLDVRYGLALLMRDPAFAVVVAGVLALGIGANTAMFSLVDAALLKPLPFPEPERIVRLYESANPGSRNGIATLNFLDWKRLNTVFAALSADRPVRAAIQIGDGPSRLSGKLVSADYFKVFGVEAQLGRTFAPGEDAPGATPVVILSHAAWQSRFGSDRTLLDGDLFIDGERHRVIGVLPPGSFDRGDAEFWKPLVITPEQYSRDYHSLRAVGRLKPGVDLAQARREMTRIGEETARLSPPAKRDWRVAVEPYDERLVGDHLRRSLYVTFGAVGLVLLIACANVANLLLAKGLARRREMAVRAALGAGQGRLVRQLLTEIAVLGLLGGAAGVGLAFLIVRAMTPYVASILPATSTVRLDFRTLAFATVVAIAVAMIVGLLPAVRTSRTTLTEALRQGGRGSSGTSERLRRAIVSGEVALTLILVCGAALLFQSLFELQLVNTGTRVENVMTASADLPQISYPTPQSAARFYESVVDELGTVPGVQRAALSTALPLEGVSQMTRMTVPGFDEPAGIGYKRVDPDYFSVLDIALLAGRGLNRRDRAGAPRAIVINEALAKLLKNDFRRPDPLGLVVRMKSFDYAGTTYEIVDWTIVGVIRDERVDDLRGPVMPVVYVALAQVPTRAVKLLVRTGGEPGAALMSIREAVRRVDPNLPLGETRTMTQIKGEGLSGTRESALLVGAFAAVAGLLAALGLYGVLSQLVAQRRREIGIRMALGARSQHVIALVVGNAFKIVVAGLILGVLGLFALSRVVAGVLFQVSPLDPLTLALACGAMSLIALLAATIPAKRASGVNPVTVLGNDG
jgi:putative ABC transport system permease protein